MGSLVDELDADLRLMARRLPNRVLVENRRVAPVQSRQLQNSLRATGSYVPGQLRVVVESPLVQAATTNTGARPHVIRPRPGRGPRARLRFKVGGRYVFARLVHHPGNVGTHWFDNVNDRGWERWVTEELARLG